MLLTVTLADKPDWRRERLDIRRRYGGDLVEMHLFGTDAVGHQLQPGRQAFGKERWPRGVWNGVGFHIYTVSERPSQT